MNSERIKPYETRGHTLVFVERCDLQDVHCTFTRLDGPEHFPMGVDNSRVKEEVRFQNGESTILVSSPVAPDILHYQLTADTDHYDRTLYRYKVPYYLVDI